MPERYSESIKKQLEARVLNYAKANQSSKFNTACAVYDDEGKESLEDKDINEQKFYFGKNQGWKVYGKNMLNEQLFGKNDRIKLHLIKKIRFQAKEQFFHRHLLYKNEIANHIIAQRLMPLIEL